MDGHVQVQTEGGWQTLGYITEFESVPYDWNGEKLMTTLQSFSASWALTAEESRKIRAWYDSTFRAEASRIHSDYHRRNKRRKKR